MSQIVVENLYKSFKVPVRKGGLFGPIRSFVKREHSEIQALQDISFELKAGELVGYIGPNGAGKSTTVKIMSGILVPDSGKCEVLGRTPWKQRKEHVRNIGVVFGQRTQLWWDVAVIESFDLLRDIYRIPKSEYLKMKDELLKQKVDLQEQIKDFGKKGGAWVELMREWVEVARHAGKLALSNDFLEIKQIVKKIGSNRRVLDKKVLMDVVPPFDLVSEYSFGRGLRTDSAGTGEGTKKKDTDQKMEDVLLGRGDPTRTDDHLHPMQVR